MVLGTDPRALCSTTGYSHSPAKAILTKWHQEERLLLGALENGATQGRGQGRQAQSVCRGVGEQWPRLPTVTWEQEVKCGGGPEGWLGFSVSGRDRKIEIEALEIELSPVTPARRLFLSWPGDVHLTTRTLAVRGQSSACPGLFQKWETRPSGEFRVSSTRPNSRIHV